MRRRQAPRNRDADAHQENGKEDRVSAFLKTTPNAQNYTAKQHSERKSDLCGKSVGRNPLKIEHDNERIKRTGWHVKNT